MKSRLKSYSLAILALFIATSLIRFPDQALEASIRGLTMWWEIVFPSLLPFFITAELLIGFGVVKFIGILFEPIMRPIFNVPGVGSFVWAMGMASGYPSGAKLTARLREERQLSKIEAERLVSFTNASNPLFIFGAVSVGFFHEPKLGILLAACHYTGNALVGVCMRFYGGNEKQSKKRNDKKRYSVIHAFRELHQNRIEDGRPFGKMFGDAVISSIQTLLMIGGFIIIFSVFNKLLFLVNITPILASGLGIFLHMIGFPTEMGIPLISGLFELTLGSQMTSQVDQASLLQQVIVVSFILAFNGFSVQAQVASILSETDIRFAPYFFARILHGVFASTLALLLFKPLFMDRQVFEPKETPVFAHLAHFTSNQAMTDTIFWLERFGPLITIFSLFLGVFILSKRFLRSKHI